MAFKIVLSSGREIYLGLEKSVERLTIQNTLLIPPDVKNIYRLSPNKYKFLNELKVHLMQMEVSTEIYPSLEELESINIANFIYFDGFSRNSSTKFISWAMQQTWFSSCGKNLLKVIFRLIGRNISKIIRLLNRFNLLIYNHTLYDSVGLSFVWYTGPVERMTALGLISRWKLFIDFYSLPVKLINWWR